MALHNFLSHWEDERLNATTKITVAWLDDLRRKAIQNSVPAGPHGIRPAASARNAITKQARQQLNLKSEISNSENLEVVRSSDPTTWIFTPPGTSTTDAEATFTLTGSRSDRVAVYG